MKNVALGDIKQTRPNTTVAFFSPSVEVIAKLDEYKASGKIESYTLDTISTDQLNKEIKIVFNNVNSFDEFMTDELIIASASERVEYCANNSISYSLEDDLI